MLDSIIVFAIAFFVLFGVAVLITDWVQRRTYIKRR